MRTLLLILLVLVGCEYDSVTGIGEVRIEPKPEWLDYYEEVLACAETRGPAAGFDWIDWYVADELLLEGIPDRVWGYWKRPNKIVLLIGHEDSAITVKHELLHYAIQVSGHGPVFDRCIQS